MNNQIEILIQNLKKYHRILFNLYNEKFISDYRTIILFILKRCDIVLNAREGVYLTI